MHLAPLLRYTRLQIAYWFPATATLIGNDKKPNQLIFLHWLQPPEISILFELCSVLLIHQEHQHKSRPNPLDWNCIKNLVLQQGLTKAIQILLHAYQSRRWCQCHENLLPAVFLATDTGSFGKRVQIFVSLSC